MEAIVIVPADRSARLQRRDHDAVVHQLQFDDMYRAGDRGARSGLIALLEAIGQVVRRLLPYLRRGRQQGGGRIDHRWQRLPFHRDTLCCVTRRCTRLGDHERHRVADMARPFRRQCKTRRHDHRRDTCDGDRARQRAELGEIGGGEHAQYAGNAACGGGIDASDGGVRMRRTHDLHPGLAGYVDVLDVLPASGQEARVFKSRERLTAEGHGSSWRSYPVVTRRAVSVIASSADEAIWMRPRMRSVPDGRGIASSLRSSQ